ncbi:crotonase/enoyl-CoA hydratase family protein [Hydrogenophaga laconesensis]|uniref:crotonase/enoyl-CoA hydratase family protein n=1 Tax=Hydrogenophaga laconesensis TaxID=1805971 RepID=UPI00195C4D1B|nr:crotonase/enoyl-CoA hydratase family protein [Hydrogenophaga laconesensis]
MEDVVLVDVHDGVMTIRINRPQARNAINLAVARRIASALTELDARADLRTAVLCSSGEHFSAGADLKAILRGERARVPTRGFGGLTAQPPKKPLIAAVEGYALGGGCEMALACDLIVASSTARFGLPEVKRGLIAAAGGLIRLPRQVPYRIAMEMALTGDPIDAEHALRIGMINRVVDAGQAFVEARRLAATVARNGPLALVASKQIINGSWAWDMDEAFDRQHTMAEAVFASDDAKEGPLAFAEKRPPFWQGR